MLEGSARALLAGVVDYAGVFPPARLGMAAAVQGYAAALAGADAWMLGRFVLPAARLDEFVTERERSAREDGGWRLSAIVREASTEDRETVARFNAASDESGDRVDSIECMPATVAGITWLADEFGSGFTVYVEIAAAPDAGQWLARVAAHGLSAKVRTGGLTADAFPTPDALLTFLEEAVRAGVPFKATAGLHHALRGAYPLTYDQASASAPMYGYLNLLLAVAALGAGHPREVARHLLTRADATGLVFAADEVRWEDVVLPAAALAQARRRHLVSFGSCSFREPSAEYRALAPISS